MAFLSGVKTNIGNVGVDGRAEYDCKSYLKYPVDSILQWAKSAGKVTNKIFSDEFVLFEDYENYYLF